jgi:hypothetical protein
MRSAGRLVGAALSIVAALTVSVQAQQLGKLPPTLETDSYGRPCRPTMPTPPTPGTLPGLGQPAQRIEPSTRPRRSYRISRLPASPTQPGFRAPAQRGPTAADAPRRATSVLPHTPEAIGGVMPGVTRDNPTGRQEPAVSIEWLGPPAAKLGQPADYTVVVRSACNVPLQQVSVRVRLAAGRGD